MRSTDIAASEVAVVVHRALMDDGCECVADDLPHDDPEDVLWRVTRAMLPLLAGAWDKGFAATTEAAPDWVWYATWDELTNPYRIESEAVAADGCGDGKCVCGGCVL